MISKGSLTEDMPLLAYSLLFTLSTLTPMSGPTMLDEVKTTLTKLQSIQSVT